MSAIKIMIRSLENVGLNLDEIGDQCVKIEKKQLYASFLRGVLSSESEDHEEAFNKFYESCIE